MLKDKHEKDTKERKVEGKTLLENIKASIDPILKSDHKTSYHIGVGARLKHLQGRSHQLSTANCKLKTGSRRYNRRHIW